MMPAGQARVGKGSFGTITVGVDRATGKTVAIKTFKCPESGVVEKKVQATMMEPRRRLKRTHRQIRAIINMVDSMNPCIYLEAGASAADIPICFAETIQRGIIVYAFG
jgi:serine/threonine protein kinase